MVKRIGRFEGSCGWSKLSVFEQCPAQFFWQYVQAPPNFVERPNPHFIKGNRVHDNIDKWLNNKHPGLALEALPMRADLTVLKARKPRTEESWAFGEGFSPLPLGFKKGDWMRMKIDALIPGKHAFVIDFKTGKDRGAKGEQPRFYGTMVMIREPQTLTVTPQFWYVEHGRIAEGAVLHRKELPALKADYKVRLLKLYTEKEWKPKKNSMCFFCDFSKERGGPCEAA